MLARNSWIRSGMVNLQRWAAFDCARLRHGPRFGRMAGSGCADRWHYQPRGRATFGLRKLLAIGGVFALVAGLEHKVATFSGGMLR
jgi:hypothetical protein